MQGLNSPPRQLTLCFNQHVCLFYVTKMLVCSIAFMHSIDLQNNAHLSYGKYIYNCQNSFVDEYLADIQCGYIWHTVLIVLNSVAFRNS